MAAPQKKNKALQGIKYRSVKVLVLQVALEVLKHLGTYKYTVLTWQVQS